MDPRPTSVEGISTAPYQATIYGIEHSRFNLQGAKATCAAFDEVLQGVSGDVAIFLEMGDVPKQAEADIRDIIDTVGFSGVIIHDTLLALNGRSPSKDEVESARAQIDAEPNVDEILRRKLLNKNSLRAYYFYRGLDRIREDKPFEYILETHDSTTSRQSQEYDEQFCAAQSAAFDLMLAGNLSEALRQYEKYHRYMNLDVRLREKDMVKDMAGWLSKKQASGGNAALFAPLGLMHVPMSEQLHNKMRSKMTVDVQGVFGVPHNTFTKEVAFATREGKKVDRESLVRAFFFDVLNQSMDATLLGRGVINNVGHRYDDVLSTVDKIVADLSVEQIERICSGKESYVEFLGNLVNELFS